MMSLHKLLHGKLFESAFFRQFIPEEDAANLILLSNRHYKVNKKLVDTEKTLPKTCRALDVDTVKHLR